MKQNNFRLKRLSLALIAVFAQSTPAFAAEQNEDKQLGEMVIKSDKPAVPANVPSITESFTAKQVAESVNSVSSAGVLQYLPSVHVRERFIGDVNGGLAIRSYGVNSSAQTIVYAWCRNIQSTASMSCTARSLLSIRVTRWAVWF